MSKMFHNQLKCDKGLEEETNWKMSKRDVEKKQNTCNIYTHLQINFRNNISHFLLAFILLLCLFLFLFFGLIYFGDRKEYSEILKRQEQELDVLKMQMQFVLQFTHQTQSTQNRISKRFQQQSMRTYFNNYTSSIKPFTHKFSDSSPDRYKRDADISTSKPHYDKAIFPYALNQTINYQKMLEKNISTILNNATLSLKKVSNILIANLTSKKQSLTNNCNTTFVLNVKTQNRKTAKDDMSGSDTLRRKRKDGQERKNKKQRQNKERSIRRTQSGPLVATFIGEVPEQQSTHLASIGPWIKRNQRNNEQFDFNKFYLAEENMAIEISLSGLYMILTTIFYHGSVENHAYWVLVKSEGASAPQRLSICAVASGAAGVSCHTNVIANLQKRDRVFIQQQQNNRYINLRDRFSQIQLVLLGEDKTSNVD